MKRLRDTTSTVWNILDGYKTYIGGAVIFVAGGLNAINTIDDETMKLLVTFGSAITVVGLRGAFKKLE